MQNCIKIRDTCLPLRWMPVKGEAARKVSSARFCFSRNVPLQA